MQNKRVGPDNRGAGPMFKNMKPDLGNTSALADFGWGFAKGLAEKFVTFDPFNFSNFMVSYIYMHGKYSGGRNE